jgi:hypothetical protein
LTTGDLSIAGDERIAICTAEASEITTNPSAQYYLLDGVGRCLPYTILAQEGRFADLKIEAFLTERTNA